MNERVAVSLDPEARARRVLKRVVLKKPLPFGKNPDDVITRLCDLYPSLEGKPGGSSPLQIMRDQLEKAKILGNIN